MKKKAKLTVIMPVFNAGEYLREALDCILAQDYTDYVVYCVEDYSDDNSYEILLEYQKKDERITVFQNSERKGAAYSRNFALEKVETQYVQFLDADDIFESVLFSRLYEAIEKTGSDISYCEWDIFQSGDLNNIVVSSNYSELLEEQNRVKSGHKLADLRIKDAMKITNSPWNFMLRSEFIQKNNIRFQFLTSRNDVYFFEMAKMCAETMIHVDTFKALVHQRQHMSDSRIGNNPNPMNIFYAFQKIGEDLKARKLWDKYSQYYIARCLDSMINAVRKNTTNEQRLPFFEFLRTEGLIQLGITKECVDREALSDDLKSMYYVIVDGTMQEVMNFNLFKESLTFKKTTVHMLFEKWKGKKVAFWGIGQRMQAVEEIFGGNMEFSVMYIDTKKAGRLYQNKEIQEYAQVVNENDVIVILNHVFEKEILETIERLGGKEQIIVLDRYIETDVRK